jgi:seryl-tRNA synthetase
MQVAKEIGGFALVNIAMIPKTDSRVFPDNEGSTTLHIHSVKEIGAILIIETFPVVSTVKAADYAVKDVEELDNQCFHVTKAVSGKGFLVITENVAALEAAVISAIEYTK